MEDFYFGIVHKVVLDLDLVLILPPQVPLIFFPEMRSKGSICNFWPAGGWEAKMHSPPNFLTVEKAISIVLHFPAASILKSPPRRLALPDFPAGTSYALTENYYPTAQDIYQTICSMVNNDLNYNPHNLNSNSKHDIPGDWFKGPF